MSTRMHFRNFQAFAQKHGLPFRATRYAAQARLPRWNLVITMSPDGVCYADSGSMRHGSGSLTQMSALVEAMLALRCA